MAKVAVIVHRTGTEFSGGSESYAMNLAKILSDQHQVDLLTTTAKDHMTWKNEYAEGVSEIKPNLILKRFHSDFERTLYWTQLTDAITRATASETINQIPEKTKADVILKIRRLPLGLTEEWIKLQGPYSTKLFEYLKIHSADYDYVVFLTYLYATTYYGTDFILNPKKVFIVPTFHEEVPAFFCNFQKYLQFRHLFLTHEERKLTEDLLYESRVAGDVIGFGLEDKFEVITPLQEIKNEKYFLYAGRLEKGKGVKDLFEYFLKITKKIPEIKLYTIGTGSLKDYWHPKIQYRGFVSEEKKLALMKGAIGFINPSPFESLSISLLEAFMMETPGLVNKKCSVLKTHVEQSSGGYTYDDYESFEKGIKDLMNRRSLLAQNARAYYKKRYSIEVYKNEVFSIFK